MADPTNIQGFIAQTARRMGIPTRIALEVARAESNFDPSAVSPKGALGVMQLMPETASELGVDPKDVRSNITGGLTYLKQMYDRFGDWRLALEAYNTGPENVEKGRIPQETKEYASTIESRVGYGMPPQDQNQFSPDILSQTPEFMRIQGPDGQMYPFPKGTTREQAISYFQSKGIMGPAAGAPPPGTPPPGTPQPGAGAGAPSAVPPPGGAPAGVPPPGAGAGVPQPGAGMPPPGAAGAGPPRAPAPTFGSRLTGGLKIGGDVLAGIGSGLAQTGADVMRVGSMIPGAEGLRDSRIYNALRQAEVPQNDAQRVGKGIEQLGEFFIPVLGEEDAALKIARYAPEIKKAVEAVGTLARVSPKLTTWAAKTAATQAPKAVTGAVRTGVLQGIRADTPGGVAKSAAIGAGTSLLTDGLLLGITKTSSGMLNRIFRTEPTRSELKTTGKLLAETPGFRRVTINKNATGLLQETRADIARELQKSTKLQLQVDTQGYLDILDKAARDPATSVKDKKRILAMAEDVRKVGGGVSAAQEKAMAGKITAIQKQIDAKTLSFKYAKGVGMTRLGDEILNLQGDLKAAKAQLAGIDRSVTPTDLNKLRNTIAEEHVRWGTLPINMTPRDNAALKLYNRISRDVVASSPNQGKMAALMKDEGGLRDIITSTAKKPTFGFGIHTLTDPSKLEQSVPPFLGWEVGRRLGGLPVGMAGAALIAPAVTPGLAMIAKGAPAATRPAMAAGLISSRKDEPWGQRKTPPRKPRVAEHGME
jgi:transglycosylase-like protein with SLT domain